MIPLSQPPSLLTHADHDRVLRAFSRTPRTHVHYDWRTLEEWLPHPDLRAFVSHRQDAIQSLIAATVHTGSRPGQPPFAWLRFILPAGAAPERDPSLEELWEALRAGLRAERVGQVVLLELDDWTGRLVDRWGFKQTNAVITLKRHRGETPAVEEPYAVREVVSFEEMARIADLDAAAFDPPWVYGLDTLMVAQRYASTLTVIEQDGEMLGYQLSTQHGLDGHLARLAVLPHMQGHGLGRMLIGEMVHFFAGQGIHTITVNTQEDNVHSQHLYERLGFVRTGHSVPVWMLNL